MQTKVPFDANAVGGGAGGGGAVGGGAGGGGAGGGNGRSGADGGSSTAGGAGGSRDGAVAEPRQQQEPAGSLTLQRTIIQLRSTLASAQPASAMDLNVVWGAGPQLRLQAKLIGVYHEREAERVRAAAAAAPGADPATMLLFDAARGYAGGAFFNAVPAAWSGALKAEELGVAVRRRYRLPIQELRSGNVCCRRCHRVVDIFGDHAEACQAHAGKYDWFAHNLVRDAFAVCAKEAGLLPETEKPALLEGSLERPADVFLPAEGGHGLGGAGSVGLGACVDMVGVRGLAPSALRRGLAGPLHAAAQRKLQRVFSPSATASAAAERAAATAAAAALEAAADDAELERVQREAYARTIQAYSPRWFVVPFAFSSLGCLADETEEVMRALAARYAASEAAGGAEAAGHGILHARWLPRLSAAIERGAWGRLRLLLREAAGAHDGDGGLVVSELLCEPRYLSRRADALGASGS